ncbi:MAG TPA: lytic murein transglycosylase B [Betaproteobacteria bacterium]|jgi:membrane-bound lytic murein transglycosylase B|nr:lytic murein transglycosylase B [Betaproteobacteria bacterium]HAU82678.1 lytic murein transglycosylase B [Betaproteobacteria bacterium]
MCILALGLSTVFVARAHEAHQIQDAVIVEFIQKMVEKHQFSQEELTVLMDNAKKKDGILNAFDKPATSKPWSFFKKLYVTEWREKEGVKFWEKHAQTLIRAEDQFGIPQEIITALIGIETNYGTYTGEFRIVDAFYTLGFYGKRRNKYFLKEFEEFLILARENNIAPNSIKGSFAGAIGIAQFMPSSYREYAIDFDGDGKADLENSVADAIGSASNYLKRHGWKRGEPIVFPVSADNDQVLSEMAGKSKPNRTYGELKQAGVKQDLGLNDDLAVGLFKLEGDEGVELWMSLKNFYVITRYNPSNNYALAMVQLSEKIKALKNAD